MFDFNLDADDVLCITTAGFWTLAEAHAYMIELRRRVGELRSRTGRALVLTDGRESQVQSVEVMHAVSEIQSILIVGKDDRAAYVVPNSLAKLQARRLASSDQLEIFLSPSAARTWLLAYA